MSKPNKRGLYLDADGDVWILNDKDQFFPIVFGFGGSTFDVDYEVEDRDPGMWSHRSYEPFTLIHKARTQP